MGGQIKILGVCYDHPEITPDDKIRFDAALSVDDNITPEGDIGVRELPGGKYLVVCHQGPYDRFDQTYDYIYRQWLPNSGYLPGDAPPFEVYLNDPHSTDPEDLLTDMHIQLEG